MATQSPPQILGHGDPVFTLLGSVPQRQAFGGAAQEQIFICDLFANDQLEGMGCVVSVRALMKRVFSSEGTLLCLQP